MVDPSSLYAEEDTEVVPEKQFDKNGKEFAENQTVRVVVDGLKAYQVPPKGRGSFDEATKAFVADAKLKYLVLPVGLRGVVNKVYDTESISANFPIRVKFEPSVAATTTTTTEEEGYSVPVPLVMHFSPQEIEIIVD